MKKLPALKGVVFDLDNTLYDEGKYFAAVTEEFCKRFGCLNRSESMKSFYAELRPASKDILSDIVERAGIRISRELKDGIFDIYTSIGSKISPYDDALDLLDFLKAKNIKTGLLTNGVIKSQENKIRCLSIEDCFDRILFARSLGKENEKPETRPFIEISGSLGIRPSEIVFVGDNPDMDFKGPKELGGFTVRIKRGIFRGHPGNEAIDKEVEDLRELKELPYA
jgi:putative hydrolase of the HAD superfamily